MARTKIPNMMASIITCPHRPMGLPKICLTSPKLGGDATSKKRQADHILILSF